jgi:L-asparaginase
MTFSPADPPRPIRVLACGGTFDKRYDPLEGALAFTTSSLPAIVERVRLAIQVVVEVVMLIDSLDMQDADRARVADACRAAPEPALVIVHGTDTMPATAAVLGPLALGKTVILTGAMVPYSIAQSDALFNLGFAFAAAQTLAPGVWVAMNGRIFEWDDVRKNRAAGVFETLR